MTQQIVNLLINGDKDFESIHEINPWIDAAVEQPVTAMIERLDIFILLVHYTDLINDKSQEVQRIANFLNVKLE